MSRWFSFAWLRSLCDQPQPRATQRRATNWQFYFTKYGFFWNEELRDFVDEYGKNSSLQFFDGSDEVTLLRLDDIKRGVEDGQYEAASEYLQERVAPVGDFHHYHVELLLTESGRLIGFCDYLLISWGDQHWRTAIPLIRQGDWGDKLGVIPT